MSTCLLNKVLQKQRRYRQLLSSLAPLLIKVNNGMEWNVFISCAEGAKLSGFQLLHSLKIGKESMTPPIRGGVDSMTPPYQRGCGNYDPPLS